MKVALLTTDNRNLLRDFDTPAPHFGTAPTALIQGFAHLPEVEVHVVSCIQARVAAPAKLAPRIFFHSLCVPKMGWMRSGFQGCIRAVRRKLKEIQPDIVHGQGTERDCAISAIFSGFPNVVTIHGNMAELARILRERIGSYGWLAGRLETFVLKRTSGVFCNSAYTEQLVRPRARRVWRVPNAVREAFFVPPQPSGGQPKPTLINVGHPGPRKRQLELLGVVRELQRQGLAFEFEFIGDLQPNAPYAAALRERMKPLEEEGLVRCPGVLSQEDLVRRFDEVAGMVHFPMEEAFGLVVAEALARNLKFFGSRVGGVPDIAGGLPGVELFETEDWRGLTAGIASWIRSGCARLGGAAEAIRARYHPAVIAQRHLEIYREVLSSGEGVPPRRG
jgi:glycosyltransferase involved in cell wall biosynthesis